MAYSETILLYEKAKRNGSLENEKIQTAFFEPFRIGMWRRGWIITITKRGNKYTYFSAAPKL